jgi:hypothetical protein
LSEKNEHGSAKKHKKILEYKNDSFEDACSFKKKIMTRIRKKHKIFNFFKIIIFKFEQK